jgi:hypothetical protein
LTYQSSKLPPPPKEGSVQEQYRWLYRVFELLNGIQSILAEGVEVLPSSPLTGDDLQTVIDEVAALILALQGNLAITVVSEETFGLSDAVGVSTVYAREDHSHGSPTDPVPAHVAESDPHTQYQKESEKGQASGYASLGAGGLVPVGQMASGTPDGTKYVRDDGTLATPAGVESGYAQKFLLMGG